MVRMMESSRMWHSAWAETPECWGTRAGCTTWHEAWSAMKKILRPAQQPRRGHQVKAKYDQMPMTEMWMADRFQISLQREQGQLLEH